MTVELPEPVATIFATLDARDTLGFLDSFTPDGVVDDWGRQFCDREAIRAWSDREFIGADGHLTVTGVAAGDQTVEVTGDWRSTHANGPSRFAFILVGGKISVMRIRAADS